jgi:hypothetical protein
MQQRLDSSLLSRFRVFAVRGFEFGGELRATGFAGGKTGGGNDGEELACKGWVWGSLAVGVGGEGGYDGRFGGFVFYCEGGGEEGRWVEGFCVEGGMVGGWIEGCDEEGICFRGCEEEGVGKGVIGEEQRGLDYVVEELVCFGGRG